MDMQIYFPHLGIHLEQVGKNFSIFGFTIAYYGVVIVIGMLIAMALIMYTAKRFGENPDNYYDVSLLAILIGIVGARAYYVFFAWDMYKDNLKEIFNIRNGGLAIYGGIIFGLITVLLYCHVKKKKFLHMADFLILGVVFGQIMGRWGNFFNREAFGEYTDGLFAMQLPVSDYADHVGSCPDDRRCAVYSGIPHFPLRESVESGAAYAPFVHHVSQEI